MMQLIVARNEVRHKGGSVYLPPREFEMLLMIVKARRRGGISPDAIFYLQYSNDPNGGPLVGRRVIHQRRMKINCKIAPLGCCIMRTKPGAGGVYELNQRAQVRQ